MYFIQCQPSWDDDTDLYSQLVKFALLYALPLLFISVTYYQIVRVLWRSARLAIVNRSNTGNTDDESASHNGTGSDFFIITFLTLSILNQSRLVSLFDADSLTSKSIFSRRLGSWQILIFFTKISQCLLSHLCYFWRRRNFSLQLYKNFQLEPFFFGNLFPVMTTISLLPKDLNDLYIKKEEKPLLFLVNNDDIKRLMTGRALVDFIFWHAREKWSVTNASKKHVVTNDLTFLIVTLESLFLQLRNKRWHETGHHQATVDDSGRIRINDGCRSVPSSTLFFARYFFLKDSIHPFRS